MPKKISQPIPGVNEYLPCVRQRSR